MTVHIVYVIVSMKEMVCKYSPWISQKMNKVETYLDSNDIGDDLEHEKDLNPG